MNNLDLRRKADLLRIKGSSDPVGHSGGKRGQEPFVRSILWAVQAKGSCPLFPSV